MHQLITFALDLQLALQTIPGLKGLMAAFTFLGTQEFFLIVMPALFWCWNAELGLRTAVMLILSNGLNTVLKLGFTSPRPYWVDARIQAMQTETTYGFPSGHAMNAVSMWGFLAAQIKRAWAWPAALLIILGISISRLYLGVHFPLDVLGGWVFGALLLWACLRWERAAAAWLKSLSRGQQWLAMAAVSFGYLGLGLGVLAALSGKIDPPGWAALAAAAGPIDPRSPEGLFTTSGMLFGLGAALIGLQNGPRFDAGGPWAQRAARFGVGLIGVLILWRGLAVIFPEQPLALGMALRWVRYALVVFWALDLAPRVFVRLKLARGA